VSAQDGLPPIPLTYGRAIRLKQVRTRTEMRETLIRFVAEDTIRQIEQHLKEVTER
jgi:hypothetical protein